MARLPAAPVFPSVADLPEPPDLAIPAVGDGRIEEQPKAVVTAGAGSVAMLGTCLLPDDDEPASPRACRRSCVMSVWSALGANCMEFRGCEAAVHVNSFPFPALAQSGPVFGPFAWRRLKPNFAASIGSEPGTTVADCVDDRLELGRARVITLFLEPARDPAAFEAALARAEAKGVPVVAMRVGHSALVDAILALSAMALEPEPCLAKHDVNPLLVLEPGVPAFDALVVGRSD